MPTETENVDYPMPNFYMYTLYRYEDDVLYSRYIAEEASSSWDVGPIKRQTGSAYYNYLYRLLII